MNVVQRRRFLTQLVVRLAAAPGTTLIRKAGSVAVMSICGQLAMVAAIPVVTRLYSPAEFGVFTVYISIVNILGAIASLRFGSSLYVAGSRGEARVVFKLVIATTILTSIVVLAAGWLAFETGSITASWFNIILWIPVGMASAAIGDAMNSWSLRFDHLRAFALGRLIQPASMAVCLIVFGVAGAGSAAMIAAHIASQLLLIGVLAAWVFAAHELRSIASTPLKDALVKARREYKFPLFDLPAALAGFAIINLPAVLIGSAFGSTAAGHFGMATRLLTGPVTMIALPLSNIYVAEATADAANRLPTAHRLLLISGVLIAIPVLAFGIAAPFAISVLLGEPWRPTGELITALALMAAVQALSTPIQETPTILRRQEVRLTLDLVRALFVFGPLIYGVEAGWSSLRAITFMSAGGALGYALCTAMYLILLRRADAASHVTAAKIAIPS